MASWGGPKGPTSAGACAPFFLVFRGDPCPGGGARDPGQQIGRRRIVLGRRPMEEREDLEQGRAGQGRLCGRAVEMAQTLCKSII